MGYLIDLYITKELILVEFNKEQYSNNKNNISDILRKIDSKAKLFNQGIIVEDEVRQYISQNGDPLTLADYASTSGITLELMGGGLYKCPYQRS